MLSVARVTGGEAVRIAAGDEILAVNGDSSDT